VRILKRSIHSPRGDGSLPTDRHTLYRDVTTTPRSPFLHLDSKNHFENLISATARPITCLDKTSRNVNRCVGCSHSTKWETASVPCCTARHRHVYAEPGDEEAHTAARKLNSSFQTVAYVQRCTDWRQQQPAEVLTALVNGDYYYYYYLLYYG
jgi:hypothetical protein